MQGDGLKVGPIGTTRREREEEGRLEIVGEKMKAQGKRSYKNTRAYSRALTIGARASPTLFF